MPLVNETLAALNRFVPILHQEAGEIVSLMGVDDALQAVMADWLRTLRTRTDFLLALAADEASEPPPGFDYWQWKPLREALSKGSFSEAQAIQVVDRISIVSEALDDLVETLQADPKASTMRRYVFYVVSDIVDVKQAIQRHFPALDDLDEKLEGK
jgi:hypothetical protein